MYTLEKKLKEVEKEFYKAYKIPKIEVPSYSDMNGITWLKPKKVYPILTDSIYIEFLCIWSYFFKLGTDEEGEDKCWGTPYEMKIDILSGLMSLVDHVGVRATILARMGLQDKR